MVSTCYLVSHPNPFSVNSNNNIFISSSSSSSSSSPSLVSIPTTLFRLGDPYAPRFTKRTKGRTFRVLAIPNGSTGEKGSNSKMVMVDPLEAKRLAAIQMQEIQAREKLKRSRRIEAINGAWAMIGLMAGLVIEAKTGKSILDQMEGYFSSAVNLFVQYMRFPGLVIEGETVKSISDQLADYWSSVVNLFGQYMHSTGK